MPALRVLAVDDNPVNRKIVKAMLIRQGHAVTLAENGVEAVAAVAGQTFDLVLMDVQMPEMDGLTATRRIRQLPEPQCWIPVVALTAHASEEAWAECAEAGMNAFATKPIRPAKLSTAMPSRSGPKCSLRSEGAGGIGGVALPGEAPAATRRDGSTASDSMLFK